jgi:dUTP pyrophosphatase
MALEPTSIPASSLATNEAPPALQVQLLSPKGRAPTRGSAFSAGYDLYSSEDTTVPKATVSTSISIAVPAGTCTPPDSSPIHARIFFS